MILEWLNKLKRIWKESLFFIAQYTKRNPQTKTHKPPPVPNNILFPKI